MNEELDINEELYTDIALQMFTAFLKNTGANDLMETYKDITENDIAFFPGVIFGCLLHMGSLLATISDMTHTEMDEALGIYASAYNLNMREHLSKIGALHPSVAMSLMQKMANEEGF